MLSAKIMLDRKCSKERFVEMTRLARSLQPGVNGDVETLKKLMADGVDVTEEWHRVHRAIKELHLKGHRIYMSATNQK